MHQFLITLIITLKLYISDERETVGRQRSMSNDQNRKNSGNSVGTAPNNQGPPQVQQYFGASKELPGKYSMSQKV